MSFNKYPYTDFHEMNLDWFLKEFKNLLNEFTTIQAAWEEFKNTYVDKIEEVTAEELDKMYEDGRLAQLIADYMNYVTPEMFGAMGNANYQNLSDGDYYVDSSYSILSHDDTEAFREMFKASNSGMIVLTAGKNYKITKEIIVEGKNIEIYGNGSTIKMFELFEHSDIRMFTFKNADSFIAKDMNMLVSSAQHTSFPDSEAANTGAIMLAPHNIKNVYIENCTINNINAGIKAQITPIWVTGSGDYVHIANCKTTNSSGCKQGGDIWVYGTFKDVDIANCYMLNSTYDESVTSWGSAVRTMTKVHDCHIVRQGTTSNIFAAQDLASLYVSDCVIDASPDALNLVIAKTNTAAAELYFYNNIVNARNQYSGARIFQLSGGICEVKGCTINTATKAGTSDDNPIVKTDVASRESKFTFTNNTVNFEAVKGTFVVANGLLNAMIKDNIFNLATNVSNYFFDYSAFLFFNNVINGAGFTWGQNLNLSEREGRIQKAYNTIFNATISRLAKYFYDDIGIDYVTRYGYVMSQRGGCVIPITPWFNTIEYEFLLDDAYVYDPNGNWREIPADQILIQDGVMSVPGSFFAESEVGGTVRIQSTFKHRNVF